MEKLSSKGVSLLNFLLHLSSLTLRKQNKEGFVAKVILLLCLFAQLTQRRSRPSMSLIAKLLHTIWLVKAI
jgi:asparagine N-glycosylation enzyme membrane subunit Stt3